MRASLKYLTDVYEIGITEFALEQAREWPRKARWKGVQCNVTDGIELLVHDTNFNKRFTATMA